METKFIYDFLLPFFVGVDERFPALQQVHDGGDGYVYATDRSILVRIPVGKVTKRYGSVPGYPDVGKIVREAIYREGNLTACIETGDFVRALSAVAWRRVTCGDECPRCDGSGKFVNDGEYRCKKCNGTGTVNIRIREFSLPVSDCAIEIGGLIYSASLVQTIAIAAQMLQAERIACRYREEGEAGVFGFAGVDVLLMPSLLRPVAAVLKLEGCNPDYTYARL